MSVDDTLKERGSTYGDIEDEAKIIYQLKEAEYVETLIPQNPLSHVQRHALDMIFVKIARIVNGDPNYADNWHDIAGYATLVEKQLAKDVVTFDKAPDAGEQVAISSDPLDATHQCPNCSGCYTIPWKGIKSEPQYCTDADCCARGSKIELVSVVPPKKESLPLGQHICQNSYCGIQFDRIKDEKCPNCGTHYTYAPT